MSTTGKSEYARVLGPYHSPNRVHTKMWPAGSAHCGRPPSWIFKNSKLLRTIPCGGQYVSLCQISSKSVTLLRRHGNLTFFWKWRPSAILDLWNLTSLTVGAVKGPILHQHTKFRKDRWNHCGDIAIFVIFQDGGQRHLGFSKTRNFNGRSAVRVEYASLYQISSKSVERLQRYGDLTFFFKMAAVRHLDLLGAYWDHPRWPLDGLHRCAKFDRHRCMSFDNMKLSIFCPFGLKTPIHAPKIGVFGGFDPQNGDQCQRNPQKEHLRVETVLAVH